MIKRIIFILLLIYPAVLSAQTAGIGGIFSTLGYFLFGGLILGSIEASIFRHSSDSIINIGKIILYNYLILILAYLIFIFFVVINSEFFPGTNDSENVMEAAIVRERIATIKFMISIVLYIIIVVGVKYIIYSKRIFISKGKDLILLLLIPNFILLGLYFFLSFSSLVWWFNY